MAAAGALIYQRGAAATSTEEVQAHAGISARLRYTVVRSPGSDALSGP